MLLPVSEVDGEGGEEDQDRDVTLERYNFTAPSMHIESLELIVN